jgi:peptidoglycan/LPS O-acetylase OafA/YrhL
MSQPTTPLSVSKRIPELDGLRGIAILLVLSFHYINNQLGGSTNKWGMAITKITSFGWVGVDLFFVLSGFLICSVLLRTRNSSNYFSTFFIRRILRIIPNYYLLIVIFLVILSIPAFANNYFLTGNNVLPAWSYFLMLHNFYMAHLKNMGNPAMSVTWSIGIEEQFYIIFPFILYYVKENLLPVVLIVAIITASFLRMGYQSWIPPYVLLPCRMDAISFGALVAWLNYYKDLKDLVSKYFYIFIGLLLADAMICTYLFIKYGDLGVIKNLLFAMVFSIMVVFALTKNRGWYGIFLRNKALVWVGTISYSLYLFHYLILGLFHHFIGNTAGVSINNMKDLLVSILAFITSLVFSWLVFKLLETPMVSWGKRFKY